MSNFAVCMTEQKKSIYQLAAEWGIPFGLYLACMGVCTVFLDWFPPLSIFFLILFVSTPLVTYYFQRRKFIADNGFTEYAALWMMGIMLFILGGMIASFVMFLVLQYGRPNFMYDQAQMAIEAYKEIPQMRDSELLHVLQRMVDENLLPRPIEMVFNAFWFIAFGGSVTSALTALVARRPLMPYRKK